MVTLANLSYLFLVKNTLEKAIDSHIRTRMLVVLLCTPINPHILQEDQRNLHCNKPHRDIT